jgi:hypothetical protein
MSKYHVTATLTNEQIVAEMGWVRQAIQDITGLFLRCRCLSLL